MTNKFLLLAVFLLFSAAPCFCGTAALVRDSSFTKAEAAAAAAIEEAFSQSYTISDITYDDLISLNASAFDALLIPNGRRLPAAAAKAIEAFARSGGDIVTLAAPLWKEPLVRTENGFTSKTEYQNSILDTEPDTVIYDGTNLDGWERGYSDAEEAAYHTIAAYNGRTCMDVRLENVHNYDTYSRSLDNPLVNGEDVLEIVASGTEKTGQLVIECDEKDGSRWMATIALAEDWQRIYISPEHFARWSGGEGRGFPGDKLNLGNVNRMSVGIALTHIPTVGEGEQEYRIAQIGASRISDRHIPLLDTAALPNLDTLSPTYKVFDCNDVKSIKANAIQAVVNDTNFPKPSSVSALNPRQQGGGYDKGREWRYINLLEAWSSKGQFRGTAAALKIHTAGDYAGAVFAAFAPGDLSWYTKPAVKQVLRDTASAMARGIFFLDAGSDYYTYFPDMKPLAGAQIINVSDRSQKITWNTYLDGIPVLAETAEVSPGSTVKLEHPLGNLDLNKETIITCTLTGEDGSVIDRVENAVNFQTKTSRDFVTIENGHFMLRGKVWKPWGANYMPSTGAGSTPEYFNNYLADYSYDPIAVERDFRKMKELGFNSINIFVFTGYARDLNLIDMLRLADKYDFKVTLSLRPGTPFDEVSESAEELIQILRLADNDSIFSYDVAWEPSWGDYGNREWFDGAWENWIKAQYGSVEKAEALWNYPVPHKEDGTVTGPKGEDFFADGKQTKMVNAYRRFLDYFGWKHYNNTRMRIRALDTNHYMSFRMSETSNPVNTNPSRIDYDFNYLVSGVDFLAPEAYGRIGNKARTKPLRFEREYGKFIKADYPMIWPEVGETIWDNTKMEVSRSKDREAAGHYRNFFEALIDSGSDGTYMWVSTAGYRVDEKSDYGIWNEDYTDREITKVIKKYGPRFLKAKYPQGNTPVKIETETVAGGISGIFKKAGEDFYAAQDSSKNPYFYTEWTGKTTADARLITLEGNTPSPDSPAPLAHLDGGFDTFTVKGHSIEALCRNLNEVTWKANGTNRVVLAAVNNNEIVTADMPADMARTDTAMLSLTLPNDWEQCTICFFIPDKKLFFGERIQIQLK